MQQRFFSPFQDLFSSLRRRTKPARRVSRRSIPLQVGFPLAASLAALVLAKLLTPHADGPVFVFFGLAVVLSAWKAGNFAAFLAAVYGFIECAYFLFPPIGSFRIADTGPVVRLGIQYALAALIVFVLSRLRTVQEQSIRLGAIVESADNAIIGRTLDGTIRYWNEGATQLFGYTAIEALGQSMDFLFPPDYANDLKRNLERVTQGARLKQYETVARRKDGAVIDVTLKISPILNKAGKIVGASLIAHDVTGRKHAEHALRQSEEKFRTLADNMSQFAWIADGQGWIFWYNRRWFEYTGATLEEMQGWGWTKVHHPEHIERVVEKVSRCFATGEIWEDTFPLRGKDGDYRWFLSRAVPIRDAQGKVVRWLGTNTDVTEQRKAEEALRDKEERLSQVIRAAGLGTWDWDIGTNELVWSPRCLAMFGFPANTCMTYELFLQAVHPGDRERINAAVERSIERHEEYDVEMRTVWPDGSVHWINSRGRAYSDHSGRPVRMSGTALDITERKRAEQALIRSEKLASVGRMAATVAHEINNPLASAMNAIFLASVDPSTTEPVHQYLAMAERELERVAHIAKQTLGFYRETGRPSSVQLQDVVNGVLDLYAPKLKHKSVSVERRFGTATPVQGIEGELRQVISNLLTNSIDAVGDHATLRVRTSGPGATGQTRPMVRLTIADNGAGISPEDLKRVFDPFFTTKEDVGTGLGLWVTKELVKKHEGKIRVRSCVGKGTVFSIWLPAERRTRQAERQAIAAREKQATAANF